MTWVVQIDWKRPPLTENQRLHWRAKAAIVATVREMGGRVARNMPGLDRCSVELEWVVTDRRRRDADNIVPTLKALCDGLVDAGVVPDDTPEYMTKAMPTIRYEKGAEPHFELTVRNLT